MWQTPTTDADCAAQYRRLVPVLAALEYRLSWEQCVGGLSALECDQWRLRLREARDGVTMA